MENNEFPNEPLDKNIEEEIISKITGGLKSYTNNIIRLNDPNYDINKMYKNFYEEVLKIWKYSDMKDEPRYELANSKYGGIDLTNKEVTALIRSTGWELIKQIGKKIVSGDFNLTTVSIPIKVMIPLTILQSLAKSLFNYPMYFNLASFSKDPIEKMKFVIVACISVFHKSSHFLKPINPILGETYETVWEDGSKLFLEQTSHHPPISHYIMYGPNNNYKYYGYSSFVSNAGLNSLKVINNGKRFVEFQDGTIITYNFCQELYSNSFWGVLRHESLGEIEFKDITNGYECSIKFNSVKKKPTDYLTGEIKLGKEIKSKVTGSYLSNIEFDGIRYWDIRENLYINLLEIPDSLPSSSAHRLDRRYLEEGKLDQAQVEKEKLEVIQRADRKLRGDSSHKK